MPQPLAMYWTMVLVDVASFTRPDRTRAHQTAVHDGLYVVLKQAFAEARIDWAACYNEDRGDGVMILVPAEVPAVVLADQLLERLVAALREHNAIHVPEASIRLRLVLHSGQVRLDAAGAVGPALNFAFRLLAAPVAKQTLRESTGMLAVVSSEEFYKDVISQEPATAPESYRRIHVEFDSFASGAWLRLLGESPEVLGLFSDAELDQVRDWLADVAVPNFAALARRAAGAALPLPRFADPWCAFTYLVDINAGSDGVPPGLVFLDALATEANGDLGEAMRTWTDRKVRQQHIEEAFEAHRRAMSQNLEESRLHLLIALEHDGIDDRRYVLSAWRQDDPEVWPPARNEIRPVEEGDVERAFDEAVVAAERAWADQRASVTLEVLLPRELLHLPVHRWSKELESGQPQPLCLDYIIILRSLERMRSTHWYRIWRERWRSMHADPSPSRIHFAGSEGDTERIDVALRARDSVAMVLTAPPPPRHQVGSTIDELTAALRSGLPVLLWHPEASPETLHDLVTWLVARGGLIGLPERTKESRRASLGSAALPFARDLVVLWDDAERTIVLGPGPS
jgi:hypothetical protein